MKKFLATFVLGWFISLSMGMHFSYASEIDSLLEKLIDKGILSASEAQQIRTETNEAIAKEDKQKQEDYKKLAKDNLPDWVKNLKLHGDFRVRYQLTHDKAINDEADDRHRGRIRLRLNVDGKVNDKLMVYTRFATGEQVGSGGADAVRSTNQSFDQTFSKKNFNLDHAYAKWLAAPWVTFYAGKIKIDEVLWNPKDLIWDSDISPEGGSFLLSKKLGSFDTSLQLNCFVIEEDATSDDRADPVLYTQQLKASTPIGAKIKATGAISLYETDGLQGKSVTNGGSGNTYSGPYEEFVNVVPAFQVDFAKPFGWMGLGFLDVENFSLFGEYALNTKAHIHANIDEKNETGWMLGFKMGAAKVSKWGDWQFVYNFARLEKDAIPDFLPDSDRYGGATGVRGHEAELLWGLGKNTYLSLDIYRMYAISKTQDPQTLVQVDWNMKF